MVGESSRLIGRAGEPAIGDPLGQQNMVVCQPMRTFRPKRERNQWPR
jgi:hypothetical protein